MILKLVGHRDLPNASIDDVVWAVYEIARPDGPTFLVIEHGEQAYAQAAGTEGRYVIESRTKFGEGFQHFRVAHELAGADAPAVIRYRQTCVRHPPRSCPLRVRKSEVCAFAEVEQAILTFAATGSRDESLFWRDVTAQMIKDFTRRPDDDDVIGQITPR